MRRSIQERKTNETDIKLELNIDGKGKSDIDSGVAFLDHMLDLATRHGLLDLNLKCDGDTYIDYHHSVEDIGIVFGKALNDALGDKKGMIRYATVYTPMDEALSKISIDVSGRSYLHFGFEFKNERVGNFETELVEEFFRGFVNYAKVTLHINLEYGRNTHHIIESIFKGFGRCIKEATRKDPRIEGVLSTKGMI